jgi:5-deoxy-5-amino-3-dehydroquinate synthase
VITVPVPLGDGRAYDVLVGAGARHRLLEVLPVGARRAVVVTQETIPVEVDPGIEHITVFVDDGEDAKCLETIEDLCGRFARWGLTRGDVVIGVGGGVVTDVAGFAASVYHRGIPVVHVATTLLGQIDAAIGGKTGVNLREGKNLVGAFWQPAAVLCDTDVLATLPPLEYRAGLGEMAKYRFLGAENLLDLPLDERVAACVRIKADVVAGDERESVGAEGEARGGRGRAILNYGHTLAHAVETATDFEVRHGEAVAIGLVYAAELALRLGRIDQARVDEHRATLATYELPMALPVGLDPDELVALMARDKKALDGFTFVLDGPRGVEQVSGVPVDAVREALVAVR